MHGIKRGTLVKHTICCLFVFCLFVGTQALKLLMPNVLIYCHLLQSLPGPFYVSDPHSLRLSVQRVIICLQERPPLILVDYVSFLSFRCFFVVHLLLGWDILLCGIDHLKANPPQSLLTTYVGGYSGVILCVPNGPSKHTGTCCSDAIHFLIHHFQKE